MRKLFFALLFLAGCGPTITDGIVSNKNYIPAHTETYVSFDYVGDVMIPVDEETHVPDRWYVEFRKADEKNPGSFLSRTVQVSKEEYDNTKPGDFFEVK